MKKFMLICAPVTSVSGYGAHARDLVKSFIKHDKYDIKILDVPWGSCARNALNLDKTEDKAISDLIFIGNQLDKQPDIYVDIRIPNEFQQYGKVNIGITAGVETTAVSQAWLDGCNKMDLVIVPSEHSKKGFVDSVYDKINNLPDGSQQKIGELKLEKPIEVLFEGFDESIFYKIDNPSSDFSKNIDNILEEDFAYLFVGQWGGGGFGEDRKDIGRMLKIFIESFANKKNKPALILKTAGASPSVLDKEDCLKRINMIKSMFPSDWDLPKIYFLHGSLKDTEINEIYNHPKVKCMISFTHGEGFGRPLLEFSITGKPVIASNWSGHLDFLDKNYTILVNGSMNKIPQSAVWKDILIEESEWFTINENEAYKALNLVFDNYDKFLDKSKTLGELNSKKFTLENMSQKLDEIIEKYTSHLSSQVSLNLPKLNKVEKKDDSLPSIKLPKLKKLTKEV